jgi:hypothetical protein
MLEHPRDSWYDMIRILWDRLQAPQPRPVDWLVVYDHVACHRLTGCTLCGGPLAWVDVDAWSAGTIVATVILCMSCKGQGQAVREKLEQQYRKERYAGNT